MTRARFRLAAGRLVGLLPARAVIGGLVVVTVPLASAQPPSTDPEAGARFRSGVAIINVTATVSDARGRFVTGLGRDDFLLFEDGVRQPLRDFRADRVPVSLGLVVDTSASMEGDKWRAAREALDRFLLDLLRPDDEVFLYAFGATPSLVHDWTTDRGSLSAALGRVRPEGATALLDAVDASVALARHGRHPKKALVIISDGNDTTSTTRLADLAVRIRESDVLVYAIGIGSTEPVRTPIRRPRGATPPRRRPGPFPGVPDPSGPRIPFPRLPIERPGVPPVDVVVPDGADAATLRDLTDESGGRTALIRSADADLARVTREIADELSQQYFLAYVAAAPPDGQWHAIRVDTRDPRLVVRARRGYVATR